MHYYSLAGGLGALPSSVSSTYQTADPAATAASADPMVLFLTGTTGYLGGYIIRDVLERTSRPIKFIAHV